MSATMTHLEQDRSSRAATEPAYLRWSGRSAAVGATLLATCFCGLGQIVFGVAAARTTAMAANRFGLTLYTGVIAVSLALILAGLLFRSRRAAGPALLGALLFGLGYLMAPPTVMHGRMAHAAPHYLGFAVVLAGTAALVWAYLRAFPTRNGGAAACAAGGFGAAVGCSCCLASGAATWLAVAALGVTVPGAPFGDGIPYVVFMSIALAGLYRLGGPRYALLGLAGAVLAFGGDEALKPFLADDIERLPRLVVSLAGTAVVVWAFARAFVDTRPVEPAVAARAPAAPAGPRALGGVPAGV